MARVIWDQTRFRNAVSANIAAKGAEAGGVVQNRAQASMKGGGKPHVPSAPGDPPHRDFGALAGSGQTLVVTDGQGTRTYVIFGSANVPYAKPLETGTRKMAARPYLRPALEASRTIILTIFRRRM